LRHAVGVLEVRAPQSRVEQALAGKRNVLRQAEQDLETMEEDRAAIAHAVDEGGDLRAAEDKLARVATQAEGRHDAAVQALDRAAIEPAEAVQQLDRAFAGFDADPKALEKAEERLFALKAAARKYGGTVDDLPAKLARFQAELAAV